MWKRVLVGSGCLVACGPPPVQTVRMGGAFPGRGSNCQLELRSESLSYELTSNFDTVGIITARGEDGEAPNDPRLLKLIKHDACALGGEVVLINTSANFQNVQTGSTSSHHSYIVLRKKSAGAVPPQTF